MKLALLITNSLIILKTNFELVINDNAIQELLIIVTDYILEKVFN